MVGGGRGRGKAQLGSVGPRPPPLGPQDAGRKLHPREELGLKDEVFSVLWVLPLDSRERGEREREGGKEGGREGEREGGREGGREGEREGGREREGEGEREREIEACNAYFNMHDVYDQVQGL